MDLETQIALNTPWSALPSKVRTSLQENPKEYDAKILTYSLQNQLRYRGNIVQQVGLSSQFLMIDFLSF